MDRYQVQVVNEFPVACAARTPEVHKVIGELIGRKQRLDARIGHGMMLQLGGDVLLNSCLVGGAEAADRVVAAEGLGDSGANQVLQAALDGAQALGRRDVGLGADE